MKCVTLSELENDLDGNPDDWSLRLKLIEGHILEGDVDKARRLVRDSPDDSPLPPELQYRLHTVMTQGAAAVERFYAAENGGELPFVREQQGATDSEQEADDEATASAGDDGRRKSDDAAIELAGVAESVDGQRNSANTDRLQALQSNAAESEKENPTPSRKQEAKVIPAKTESKSGGSTTSKIAQNKALLGVDDGGSLKRPAAKPWQAPPGFEFDEESAAVAGEKLAAIHERTPQAGLKVSAFTLALIVHIVVAVAFAFIVVSLRLPEPPKIIAVHVMAEREPVIAPRLVKRDTPKSASAAAQPTSLISTTGTSDFLVPEFDMQATPDVTSLAVGVDAGQGMSFRGAGAESNVNFFGIRSGGKRIVFIIDATRYMLVDEKGGMYAYDKVKAEVAAMLSQLNRGTAFNIILYEGKTLSLFREEPVPAKPSSVRIATQWLDSLNRNYEALGLGRVETSGSLTEGVGIIEARDNTGHQKAIQLALEMDVNAVFTISSGYQRISRSLTAEQMAEVRKMNEGRERGTVDPKDRERWNQAVEKTREWLRNENAARAEKGLAPKVVINFTALVRKVTGESPPRATGGSPAPSGMPSPGPPYSQEEIEDHIQELVKHFYKKARKPEPEIHMVVFLGEDEEIGNAKDHFRNLTRKNGGKLKILKGLAALSDVTGVNR